MWIVPRQVEIGHLRESSFSLRSGYVIIARKQSSDIHCSREETLFSQGNPYHVAGPIENDAQFVGRKDAIAWLWQTLNAGERLALIAGPPLIGKSSLLLRMARETRTEYLAVYLDVAAAAQSDCESLLSVIIERLHQVTLEMSAFAGTEISADAPASVWRALRELNPEQRPLLLLDNLDLLLASGADAGWQFLDDLAALMEQRQEVKVVCAVRSREGLMRVDRLPFFRAPWRRLEALSRSEAAQLIKNPSAGVLEFDYDAITRIDELTGRLPYFIQLLCGEIFEQKAGGNYVTVVDIEPATRALGQRESIGLFQDAWDAASPEGKLVLSLLGSLKGAYEVFTQAELSTGLRAHGIQANLTEITLVLNDLVQSGALHQLGSLSYRLWVELFRYWLRIQHPIEATAASYRWQPQKRRAGAPPASQEQAAPARSKKLTLTVLVPLVTLLIAIGLIIVLQSADQPPAPSPTPTHQLATMAAILLSPTDTPTSALSRSKPASPTPLSTSEPAATDTPPPAAIPSDTATSAPTRTATPTRPVVVARAMPAIAYMHKAGTERWQIWLIDADGKSPIALTDGTANDSAPIWSPEGLRMAFVSDRDENQEIYTMNMDGSNPVNLTNNKADDWTPAWSPDGTELAFSSMRDGNWEIYVMWADGADPIRLTNDPESDFAPTWSPDGKSIAFASKRGGNWDIYVMDRDGKNVRQLTDAKGSDLSPAWSPDGKYIAFESTRDGNTEIYRMQADGSQETNLSQNPLADDHWPTWSPDGRRLAFCSNRDKNWDIYVMPGEGGAAINLTNDEGNSQGPAWRP
jgi:hypothetical protein